MGEDVGKSPNVQTWGTPVNLRVTVPLTDDGQLHNNTHTNIEYIVNVQLQFYVCVHMYIICVFWCF